MRPLNRVRDSFPAGLRATPTDRSGSAGIARTLAVVFVALLAGCATGPITVPPAESPDALPRVIQPFAEPRALVARDAGERAAPEIDGLVVENATIESAYGCTVRYEYYEPAPGTPAATRLDELRAQGIPPGLVVIGHGFMRDLTAMRGWAAEWAQRGIRAVVVSFCNSSWFNGRHDRNAEDLEAVARHLEPGDAPIVYVGFSAGGLSALLAAANDDRAVGYLGLDPVDSGDLAAGVTGLAMPALFLFGAPGSCNAENNMIDTMPPAALRIALRIPYASHCDFEHPYDPACSRICGAPEPPEAAEAIRSTIHGLATAWVSAQLGSDPEAQLVFHRGTLDDLEAAYRVEIVGVDQWAMP